MSNSALAIEPRARPFWGWGALALFAVVPLWVWWQSIGDPTLYISYQTPPGQALYVASKLIGLYALVLGWLQVILVLSKSSGVVKRTQTWTPRLHRFLGLTALGAMLLHAALFIAAASLRTGHFASGLLLPNFDGFYATAVTLGLFAVIALIAVAVSGILRAAGVRAAYWVHRLAVPALLLAMLHSLLIGSETRDGAVMGLYAVMAATLVWSVARAILSHSRR